MWFVFAGLALSIVMARADVTDAPKDDLRYEDGQAGTIAKTPAEVESSLTETERKELQDTRRFVDAIKALRPTEARPCPKVAIHYIDGDDKIGQFAKHAAANNTCAINLYFGHTTGGNDDAAVRNAMKPLNDAPAPAKPSQQSRSGVWGCYAAKFNAALKAGRKVSKAGDANDKCERLAMQVDAADGLPKILASDAVALCEACGNAVTLHLYFADVARGAKGNENGYSTW